MKDRRKPCIECGKLCWARGDVKKCNDCKRGFGMRFGYTKEQIFDIIKNSPSKAQVLEKMGLACRGGNYKCLDKFLVKYNIDTSHFLGQAINRGKLFGPKRPIEDYLSNEFSIQSHQLKNRLIKENIFQHMCYVCGRSNWEGQVIPLELDHVNGDHGDNSLSNLRLVCPNCHAQTSNYRGKNKKSDPRDSNPHLIE